MDPRAWPVATLALALVLGACSESSSPSHGPGTLITRSALGGIHLGDSRKTVNALLGSGRDVRSSGGTTTVVYRRARMTVFFAAAGAEHPGVYMVRTASPRYRTRQGIGVGSPVSRLAALPGMSCSLITRPQSCLTRPDNGVPGLLFDATAGRISVVWLLVRTD